MPAFVEIPLTQGKVALIDAKDGARITCYKWYACFQRGRWYAMRRKGTKAGRQVNQYLHHLILPPIPGKEVDHKFGNGLDNRRKHLRYFTRRQNNANRRKSSGLSSRYKGVTWDKQHARWRAQIQNFKKHLYLGLFKSERAAARAYDRAARRFFGLAAKPNFSYANRD